MVPVLYIFQYLIQIHIQIILGIILRNQINCSKMDKNCLNVFNLFALLLVKWKLKQRQRFLCAELHSLGTKPH